MSRSSFPPKKILGQICGGLSADKYLGSPYKIVIEKIHPPALLSTLRTEEGGMTRDFRASADVLMDALLLSDQRQQETLEKRD